MPCGNQLCTRRICECALVVQNGTRAICVEARSHRSLDLCFDVIWSSPTLEELHELCLDQSILRRVAMRGKAPLGQAMRIERGGREALELEGDAREAALALKALKVALHLERVSHHAQIRVLLRQRAPGTRRGRELIRFPSELEVDQRHGRHRLLELPLTDEAPWSHHVRGNLDHHRGARGGDERIGELLWGGAGMRWRREEVALEDAPQLLLVHPRQARSEAARRP
mmetsp:Transcript_8/g.28  ORF Transcript_8/g.28 Transcript_8/m.28 type:complete len:227 (-) Transcript_8:1067-1747(-)